MPEIRVYLLTCRRAHLLPRALRSLLAQTFTDWVCELHNDAPEDDEPRRVLQELAGGDDRFRYVHHRKNLGAVPSFNLAHRPIDEPFFAILEDDNWWAPELLASLIGHLRADPGTAMAWANMHIHEEQSDGSWKDTGMTVWPPNGEPRRFEWPVLLQLFDTLHSNGAMLCRHGRVASHDLPAETPFGHMEPIRERAFVGPVWLDPRPLAYFAVTRSTSRSDRRDIWLAGQMLVAASFLKHVELSPTAWRALFVHFRSLRPRNTNLLIVLALAGVRTRTILRHARPADWARFLVSALRHPGVLRAGLRFRSTYPGVWSWLDRETAARTAAARSGGFVRIEDDSLLTKWPSASQP